MSKRMIERHFGKMGARAKVHSDLRSVNRTGISIDIGRDAEGEFFDISVDRTGSSGLSVVDIQPKVRHLLLMSRQGVGNHKFLCGHDERAWFVAAVPGTGGVSNVRTAMEALKPRSVRWLQDQVLKVKPKKRNRRRNEAFIRQGEWFFVPVPSGFRVDKWMIFRNEPIRRGLGKPHFCEELVRQGGEVVYVSDRYPQGVTEAQYRKLLSRKTDLRHLQWSVQRRNPQVFVRGKVRHADHKTIVLNDWHQVLMNTETQSVAMRHVAFID